MVILCYTWWPGTYPYVYSIARGRLMVPDSPTFIKARTGYFDWVREVLGVIARGQAQ